MHHELCFLHDWTVCHKGMHVPHIENKVCSASELVASMQELQEALAGFLSITSQGMSAWMMQSMSNFTSDEIKKEYANEMMKQHNLKIHHDNVKMMKELTETKSLSSSSSTPPVNDILCKSTNIKILSAPSLPTPDNENEKEKEDNEEDNEGEKDLLVEWTDIKNIGIIATTCKTKHSMPKP